METDRHFLDIFFNPRNIAVVGVSRNPQAFNSNLFHNLVKLGFSGKLYPVNPNADEFFGIKAYSSLQEIQDDVDLVISSVPARLTLDIMKACVEKKVKCVVLVSGGFSETGQHGKQMQDEIAHLLKENGIRVIGPNVLSPINCSNNLVISFHDVQKIRKGTASFIFQSGMYDLRINWLFSDFHLSVSKLIDLGNKMDVSEVEALEYLAEDPDTEVIGIHLESLKGDGREFAKLLRSTTMRKPVVVLKTGSTMAGAMAAASHTGAIVKGSNIVFDTVLKQSGAIQTDNIDDFFDFAKAFEFLNPPKGNKCVFATISGGEGVLAMDICQREGLVLASPSRETLDRVGAIFPPWEIPVNPLDLGICFQFSDIEEIYRTFIESMAQDANVDIILINLPVVILPFPVKEFCRTFAMAREMGKTIVTWAVFTGDGVYRLAEEMEMNNIPVYTSAARAIKAVSTLYTYKLINKIPD